MSLPKTVLSFSGGKDSLACLYLLQSRWDEITVMWCNSGAAFPETLEQMAAIKALVPHFVEVQGHQSIGIEGYPADVVPVASTFYGHQFEGTDGFRFQSRYHCCAAALWTPTLNALRQLGATYIIRGEKNSDHKKSGLRTGIVVEGITYEFPLADWSDGDVMAYLNEKGIALPANYRYMTTGLDCWNCTAYLDENVGRMDYMRAFHPQKAETVSAVLRELFDRIHRDTQSLRELL